MCMAGMGGSCLYPPCVTTSLSLLLPFSTPVPSSLLFLSSLQSHGYALPLTLPTPGLAVLLGRNSSRRGRATWPGPRQQNRAAGRGQCRESQ